MEAVTRRQYIWHSDRFAQLRDNSVLPSELGSRTMAWVKGRTTSVDNRESAASARAGLNNFISTCALRLEQC
jgi:hypothetical protein